MPLAEQQKRRSRPLYQTDSKLPTGAQKRPSSDLTSTTKGKNGTRSISNTANVKGKISVMQKPSVLHVKKSNSGRDNLNKAAVQHPTSSHGPELGLTKLLAAASAAVAVSPGVIRRGIEEREVKDNELTTSPSHEHSKPSEHDKGANVLEDTNRNGDTKNVRDEKYNTFARAIELLPSFNDIEDEDDDIEVPEILLDVPVKEENLDPIREDQTIKSFTKNVKNHNPENTEKCKVIESKMLQNRRHYKKDSRFVLDLYTLTFDEDESVDSIDTRGPLLTEDSIYLDERKKEQLKVDLSKIRLKENSSYVSSKNNYHDFVSLEDYLLDFMSPTSCNGGHGENTSASTSVNASLQSNSELANPDNENENNRSLSGIRVTDTDPIADHKSSNSLSGPISLPFGSQLNGKEKFNAKSQMLKNKITSIPCLETNLHKILARKFAEEGLASSSNSEELSFKKAKLLTKAYYRLLRSDSEAVLQYSQSSGELKNFVKPKNLNRAFSSLANITPSTISMSNNPNVKHKNSYPQSTTGSVVKPSDRLKWKALISADNEELGQIVSGLSNTAQALNVYLVDLLLERDGLLNKQDEMLAKISELADELLE